MLDLRVLLPGSPLLEQTVQPDPTGQDVNQYVSSLWGSVFPRVTLFEIWSIECLLRGSCVKNSRFVMAFATLAGMTMAILPTSTAGASSWNSYLPNLQTATNVTCGGSEGCVQFYTPAVLGVPATYNLWNVNQSGTIFPMLDDSAFNPCRKTNVSQSVSDCPTMSSATSATLQSYLGTIYSGATDVIISKIGQVGDGSIGEVLGWETLHALIGNNVTWFNGAENEDLLVQNYMGSLESFITQNVASSGSCLTVYGVTSVAGKTAAAVNNQRIACEAYWELEMYDDLFQAAWKYTENSPPACVFGGTSGNCRADIANWLAFNLQYMVLCPNAQGSQDWLMYLRGLAVVTILSDGSLLH